MSSSFGWRREGEKVGKFVVELKVKATAAAAAALAVANEDL